jgi:hypothetical protein
VKPALLAAAALALILHASISLRAAQSPQPTGDLALGVYRNGSACGVDFDASGAATDLMLSLVRLGGGTEVLVISTNGRRFYSAEKQFDLVAAHKRFELSFHLTEDGPLVFPLDPGNAPFLDALVSGGLISFRPARRDPPSTTVRLPGGVETYRCRRAAAIRCLPAVAGGGYCRFCTFQSSS